MKKIVCLLIIILITGCGINKEKEKVIDIKDEDVVIENDEPKEVYIDNNEIKIAFYEGNGDIYKKINTFNSTYGEFKEIGIFSMLLSEDEEVTGNNRKSLYQELSSKYSNFSNYKIGYSLKFNTIDSEINENILKPYEYNSYPFGKYIYVWLYDDINTTGWHSHVEPDEYNDNTILSSIKLMWAPDANLITSPVELSVFTYDEDDFDEKNHYRGNSKNSVIINMNK